MFVNAKYKSTVAKLCKLIKPSGYLRMEGSLGGTFYMVGSERFYVFPLTRTMVEEAMQEAHMEDVKIEVVELKET